MNRQYVFFAPLPRSGSNLLSSILNQNPEIHSEGVSGVVRFLVSTHDLLQSDLVLVNEIQSVHRFNNQNIKNIYQKIIDGYYHDIENKIIIDKNSNWCNNYVLKILNSVFAEDYKIIVLERDIFEVFSSLKHVIIKDWQYSSDKAEDYILHQEGIFMRPIQNIIHGKINKNNNFLFINYKDIIENTKDVVYRINNFIGTSYTHQFDSIEFKYPEDTAYTSPSFMDVRSVIEKRDLDIKLSNKAIDYLKRVDYIFSLTNQEQYSKKDLSEIIDFCNSINKYPHPPGLPASLYN